METRSSMQEEMRSATATLHRALENTPLSAALMKPDVSREDYIAYLDTMYRAHSFHESVSFPLLASWITDMEDRRKTPMILADLDFFSAPVPKQSLEIDDYVREPAFALGWMYVMEGSILGGRMLLKHLQQALGVDAGRGGSFFYGYGERTSQMWKGFLEILESRTATGDIRESVIHGAVHAFTRLGGIFSDASYQSNQ